MSFQTFNNLVGLLPSRSPTDPPTQGPKSCLHLFRTKKEAQIRQIFQCFRTSSRCRWREIKQGWHDHPQGYLPGAHRYEYRR
jgi:hypothetical protein